MIDTRFKGGRVIAIIDCNNFKSINDNYGHNAGDEILIFLGKTIKS